MRQQKVRTVRYGLETAPYPYVLNVLANSVGPT